MKPVIKGTGSEFCVAVGPLTPKTCLAAEFSSWQRIDHCND